MNKPANQPIADFLQAHFGQSIRIGNGCDISDGVEIEIDEGGLLVLGDRISLRRGSTIQVHRGATIVIGEDVAIGENVFISVMVGLRIGPGVGISNMVDIHDHNHQERSSVNVGNDGLTPWASGFVAAPIIIDAGAIVSNKVSITAGVRIGQNAVVGANAVVTNSIPPNTVAAGVPARPIRTFDGPLIKDEHIGCLRMAWFGTSIMEHLEGYSAGMVDQACLPAIGTAVTVESWRNRGYVHRLHLSLQAQWPQIQIIFDNRGEGGATSRDILNKIRGLGQSSGPAFDIAFLGCGINDVWRRFQGRMSEAVDSEEFSANYREMLQHLGSLARRVVCISETPFGWVPDLDVPEMNSELERYNKLAAKEASEAGIDMIDVWSAFRKSSQGLGIWEDDGQIASLWSDGIHLSELGDTLMLQMVESYLLNTNMITDLTRYDLHERDKAQAVYHDLFSGVRDV